MTIAEATATGSVKVVGVLQKVTIEFRINEVQNALTLTEAATQAQFCPGHFLRFPTHQWLG